MAGEDEAIQRPAVLFPLFLILLIGVPGAVKIAQNMQGRLQPPPGIPNAAFDRFMMTIRTTTPPQMRLVLAGTPPGPATYRATFDLYPRRVDGFFPTDFAHSFKAPDTTRHALYERALQDHATSIVLWDMRESGERVVGSPGAGGQILPVSP